MLGRLRKGGRGLLQASASLGKRGGEAARQWIRRQRLLGCGRSTLHPARRFGSLLAFACSPSPASETTKGACHYILCRMYIVSQAGLPI